MQINEVNAFQGQPGRTVKKFDEDGNLCSVSIFKDVNGDGKEDLYKVTIYSKMYDGGTFERTVIDRDGDGYNDYKKDTMYNEKGVKTEEREIEEEDINQVKKRNHLEYEIYNRRMDVHESGMYMI